MAKNTNRLMTKGLASVTSSFKVLMLSGVRTGGETAERRFGAKLYLLPMRHCVLLARYLGA